MSQQTVFTVHTVYNELEGREVNEVQDTQGNRVNYYGSLMLALQYANQFNVARFTFEEACQAALPSSAMRV